MAIWDNSGVKYTDTSTVDLGSSTEDINLIVNNNSGVIELIAGVASGTWNVKTGIRII
jgi:hypothetical protein